MCCGQSSSSSPGSYVWTDGEGVDHGPFPSEIDAKAAKVTGGGGGSVHPA